MMKRIFNLPLFSNLITLVLIFSNAFTTFAQNKPDKPKPTEAEKREARETATKFTYRFLQTRDINSFVKILFVNDFAEQYKTLVLKGTDENDKEVSFNPVIRIKMQTLKSLSNDDWKRLYVSGNNFLLSVMLFITTTEVKSKDEISDGSFERMFPAKLKELFAKNPNLAGLIEDDLEKSKPVESKNELLTALSVLETGTKIFNNIHRNNLTRSEVKQLSDSVEKREQSKTWVEVSDENNYFGLTKGSRIIYVVSPLSYTLVLTKKNGKMKIILAGAYDE